MGRESVQFSKVKSSPATYPASYPPGGNGKKFHRISTIMPSRIEMCPNFRRATARRRSRLGLLSEYFTHPSCGKNRGQLPRSVPLKYDSSSPWNLDDPSRFRSGSNARSSPFFPVSRSGKMSARYGGNLNEYTRSVSILSPCPRSLRKDLEGFPSARTS